MADEDQRKMSAAARLFDVRRVIGGLFVVYGVLVTLLGVFDSQAELNRRRASGSTCGWAWRCWRSACSCSSGCG
jgi:hypothetical protein